MSELSQSTLDLLCSDEAGVWTLRDGEYGVFIHVPADDAVRKANLRLPEDLDRWLRLARANGCTFVLVDGDHFINDDSVPY